MQTKRRTSNISSLAVTVASIDVWCALGLLCWLGVVYATLVPKSTVWAGYALTAQLICWLAGLLESHRLAKGTRQTYPLSRFKLAIHSLCWGIAAPILMITAFNLALKLLLKANLEVMDIFPTMFPIMQSAVTIFSFLRLPAALAASIALCLWWHKRNFQVLLEGGPATQRQRTVSGLLVGLALIIPSCLAITTSTLLPAADYAFPVYWFNPLTALLILSCAQASATGGLWMVVQKLVGQQS